MKQKSFYLLIVMLLFANNLISQSLEDCIAYYPFNNKLEDISGNNNHGYEIGKLQFGEDRKGQKDKSLILDGRNGYIHIPHSESFNKIGNEITISVWVKYHSFYRNKWGPICSKTNKSQLAPQFGFNTGIYGNGFVEVRFKGGAVTLECEKFQTKKWYNITVSIASNICKLYINGEFVTEKQILFSTFENKQPLEIGRDSPGSKEYLNGQIDELVIFAKKLGAKEIKTIYKNKLNITSNLKYIPKSPEAKIYSDHKGNFVVAPLGDISFADKVISYQTGNEQPQNAIDRNPQNALGIPDFNSKSNTDVSLGCNGEIILEFTDNALINREGIDLFVFEVGDAVEPTKLSISEDGIEWLEIGLIKGGIASVDLGKEISSKQKFYFVKLKDVGTGCGGTWPGADIDAVAALGSTLTEVDILPETTSTDFTDEINVSSQKVKIKIWDMAKEDGDLVEVLLNGKSIIKEQAVLKDGHDFEVDLKSGVNIFEIKALNEGNISPNTAAILIKDGKNDYQTSLSSKKGKSKKLKIIVN